MIPILYESNERLFTSNGLGRLRDCIECRVTEERNSIYECDFSYPVNGQNFEEIQFGRIIAVEHDDSGDVQPFDIVSASKPINGVVEFHAVHISYRLSGYVFRGTSTAVNDLPTAFHQLDVAARPSPIPFTFETDKDSTGYVAAFNGVPQTVRAMLGGVEGSILDTYGGEYEWNRWRVILHKSRGTETDFSIRYGVNLLDYNDDTDYSETYSSVVAYWTNSDGAAKYTGVINASQPSPIGRDMCVPLDLTDKFENEPTTAELESMARSILEANRPYLPTQTITVDFIRLQDTPEYQQYSTLMSCKLCDTIKVIMPMYGTEGRFKVVKTVWNVLRDAYDEMELGTLSTTLSEALGINQTGDGSGTKPADFVSDYGSNSSGWFWRKWNSGRCEAWGNFQFSGITVTTQNAGTYWGNGGFKDLSLPSSLFTAVDCAEVTNGQGTHASGVYPYGVSSLTTSNIQIAFRAFASSSDVGCPAFVKVYGSWR